MPSVARSVFRIVELLQDRAVFHFSLSDFGGLMSSRPKLPPHGTPERYRLERKAGKTCERCRACMASLRKEQRANRAAADARSKMHALPPAGDDAVNDTSDEKPSTASTGSRQPKVGVMETSVYADIEEIDPSLQVPFHRTLAKLAIGLAREIDAKDTSDTARRDARKQLFEVLKSMRTQKEGDDASALHVLLEQAGFGLPLVPGRPS